MSQHPAGFLSYVRTDDAHESGRISELRNRLQGEVQVQSGDNTFHIFQDREDIAWGQQWQQRIDESLDAVTFLIPIITPGFFKSDKCREELERFLDREKQLQRNDLILPIYYIECPILSNQANRREDFLASIIAERQYADWREHRFEPLESPTVRKMLAELAKQIVESLGHTTTVSNSPTAATQDLVKESSSPRHADERLNKTIEFGSSLQDIADGFKSRMDEFNSIDGSGHDKYLEFGAYVYSCVARSLDRFLVDNATTPENRDFVKKVSLQLKRLANVGPDYLKNNVFSKFWDDGTEVCEELIAHAHHMERFARD